jgi:hypothetical protein
MASRTLLAALVLTVGVTATAYERNQEPPRPAPPAPQGARDPAGRTPTGTAAIAGVVVAADASAQPMRHATVTLNGGGLRNPKQTVTDSAGRFLLADLPAASYSLSASKPAYVSIPYGAKQPGQPTTQIVLTDGQRVTVEMRLLRGAVLAGTILDQYSRPATQVRVQVMQYKTQGGQRRLVAGVGNNVSGGTDDRGAYRVFGLPPGDYFVSAVPQNNTDIRPVTADEVRWAQQGQRASVTGMAAALPPAPGPTVGFAPTFYPGVPDLSSATAITLGPGEERTGMDFQLQPVPTARIEGTVLDPDGRQPREPQLNLLPEERLTGQMPALGLPNEYGRVDANGKFTFTGVTPGRYTVFARANGPAAAPPPPPPPPPPSGGGRSAGPPAVQPAPPQPPAILWATAQVDVNGRDISNLALTLQPGLTVAGRVAFEGSTLPPPGDLTRVRVTVSQMEQNPIWNFNQTVSANQDGTFAIRGATPGRYRLSASVPSSPGPQGGPWVIKSVLANGRETLDSGLDIASDSVSGVVATFTDRLTDLTGTLLDGANHPTREFWVLVFSTDRTFWTPASRRVRPIRPGTDGKFRLSPWPPGEYYVVAVADGDQIDLTDTQGLERLAAMAFKITLAEGERKVQDLRLAR